MRHVAAVLFTATLLCAGSAAADPIGPTCDDDGDETCQGGIYWLLYSEEPTATDEFTETYQITFRMDTTGLPDVISGVDTVAVKITDGSNLYEVGSSISDAPEGKDNWNGEADVGLNADGCGNGGGGFYCAQVIDGGIVPQVKVGDGILEWVFDLRIDKGTLFTGLDQASVKARFVNGDGVKVGDLLSEDITLQVVPEPGSLALLGMGLLGLAALGRPGAA